MKVKGEGEVSQSRREKCFGLINDVFTPTVNILWIKHHLSNLEIPRETSNWVMKLKYAPYTARSVASCFQPLNVFCFLIPFKCHPCSEATWVIFNFVCISYSLAHSRCVSACAVCFCACVHVNFICMYSEYKYCTYKSVTHAFRAITEAQHLMFYVVFFFFLHHGHSAWIACVGAQSPACAYMITV